MMSLRGWFGEKKATFNMWLSLEKDIYPRFHDLIISSMNGTTQIDHVVVSEYGLFIVETKNKKGWIFGSEKQPKWTQSIYGKKYTFQNPLRQTFRQKKVLSEFLEIDESLIHTIVYFVGDCSFKTHMPENVLHSKLARYIKTFQQKIITPETKGAIMNKINKHLTESNLTTRDHIQSLRDRHNSTTICPKCGKRLALRMAKTGANAGSKFLGCTGFPKCKYTKSA
jgi:hypothetical protein